MTSSPGGTGVPRSSVMDSDNHLKRPPRLRSAKQVHTEQPWCDSLGK